MKTRHLAALRDIRLAKRVWPEQISTVLGQQLRGVIERHGLSVLSGDIQLLQGKWYITHSGLLRVATRHGCHGIRIHPVPEFCDKSAERWVFEAMVFKSRDCKGFVGYGDADPSNVSPLVHGAEMRVAETRAVNRALRKAYGIGICSVEEIGSLAEPLHSLGNRRSSRPNPSTGTMAAPKFATASASSSASTNSMPPWSSPTPSISAAPRASAKPPASRSKTSSPTWPTGPRKTGMPCSASSTAISSKEGAA